MTAVHIALVCSGAEPGRDGVGDYARRLDRALRPFNVKCAILALNDPWIDGPNASSSCDEGETPLLRLSRKISRQERRRLAADFLAKFNPDWVSFQFVCYGFNPKGIVIPELGWLPRLFAPYRLEMTCHEAWIGQGLNPSIKDIAVGAIQREAIRLLIKRLHPGIVHTTNKRYAAIFQSIGVVARILPLFSNIPVTAVDGADWVLPALHADGLPDIAMARDDYWVFGLFGNIVPKWPADAMFTRLEEISARAGRTAIVVAFGNIGKGPGEMIARWREQHPSMHFTWLGIQPAPAISEIINTLDFAISSHENHAIGKSGSAAAFLEHGLPVITSWGRDEKFPVVVEPPFDRLVWHDDSELEQRMRNAPPKVRTVDRTQDIARRFLEDLGEIS